MSRFLTRSEALEIRFHHAFGVDHRLVVPVVYGLLQFNAQDRLKAVLTEGLRAVERQRELVAKGASRTMWSKHLDGQALDVAILDGSRLVSDIDPHYRRLAGLVLASASSLGFSVTWGGDWRSLKDGCHFEL